MSYAAIYSILLIACCVAGDLVGKGIAPKQISPKQIFSKRVPSRQTSLKQTPWSSAVIIDKRSPSAYPSVAMDDQGNAIAVWTQAKTAVMVSQKPQAGAWSAPVMLSDPQATGNFAQVAIDAGGNALATWWSDVGVATSLQAAYLKAESASWEQLESPFPSNNDQCYSSSIAFDSEGNALAAWGIQTGETYCIKTARLDANSLRWTLLDDLEVSFPTFIKLVVDDSDTTLMVWMDRQDVTYYFINSARLAKDDTSWSSQMSASPIGIDVGLPFVTLDTDGNAVVVWDDAHSLASARLAATATSWEAISGPSGENVEPYGIGMDAKGNATVIWTTTPYSTSPDDKKMNQLLTTTLASGATEWDLTLQLDSDVGFMQYPLLSLDESGNALVTWRVEADEEVIKVATRNRGTWSSPVVLSKAADDWGAQGIGPQSGTAVILYLQGATLKAISGSGLFK